jgi:hypothetical protein
MNEGVFIGPKSSGRPVLRAYVRYLSTAVQRLFRTIRYYTVDSMNSAAYVHHFGYVRYTVHRVRLYYLSECTSGGVPPYVCAKRQQCMSGLLAYVRTKRQERTSTNPNIRPH